MGRHGGKYQGERRTPRAFFDEVAKLFGEFDVDVAASADNALCDAYFTKEDDAIKQPWIGRCWCNPPYDHKTLDKFARKAFVSARNGQACTTILCPATKTDQPWFHRWAMNATYIVYLRGRIHFDPPVGVDERSQGDHASMLLLFDSGKVCGTPDLLTASWHQKTGELLEGTFDGF